MNEPAFNPYAPPIADANQGRTPAADESGAPADRATRLGARMVDGLLLTAAAMPGILTAVIVGALTRPSPAAAALMFVGGGGLLCYQWWLIATTGQSLGKRYLHIRILKDDGSPLGFVGGVIVRSWVPALLSFVPYVGWLFGIADAVAIFGDERRCLHDRLAGTRVVTVGPAVDMGWIAPSGNLSGAAVAAGYLGLLGLLVFPLAALAIILGIFGVREVNLHPERTGKGRALTGIVLGALSILLWSAIFLSARR